MNRPEIGGGDACCTSDLEGDVPDNIGEMQMVESDSPVALTSSNESFTSTDKIYSAEYDMPVSVEPQCDMELVTDNLQLVSKESSMLSKKTGIVKSLKSIIRMGTPKCRKHVSFPDDDLCLASSVELQRAPWQRENYTTDEIISEYLKTCSKFKIVAEDLIINQLQDIPNNNEWSKPFNLTGITITHDTIETLETIFKMGTFKKIYVSTSKCHTGSAMELFNILEYYSPTLELIISDTIDETIIWDSLISALKNMKLLHSLSFREMTIDNQNLRLVLQAIDRRECLTELKFIGCAINGVPTSYLAQILANDALTSLHLCFINLYCKEADILSKFLTMNSRLKILDLSYNKIGDRGFKAIAKALCEQYMNNLGGVEVLTITNNRLTKNSACSFEMIISSSYVHTANLGLNGLTDCFIADLQNAINSTIQLKALGLQSTLLTCSGLRQLTHACINNKSLLHLNLRGNKAIQPDALNELADVIHQTSLCYVDLDDSNRSCNNPQQYVEVVNKIRNLVAINKSVRSKYCDTQFLNCEPEYVPRFSLDVNLRSRTRTLNTRFKVVKIAETTSNVTEMQQNEGVVKNKTQPEYSEIIEERSSHQSTSSAATTTSTEEDKGNVIIGDLTNDK